MTQIKDPAAEHHLDDGVCFLLNARHHPGIGLHTT